MFKKLIPLICWAIVLSVLMGCATPTPAPTLEVPTATSLDTATPTAIPATSTFTPTATDSPEPTVTSTASATATATETATATPTATMTRPPLPTLTPTFAGVVPGTYLQGGLCVSYHVAYQGIEPVDGTVAWCISSVIVRADNMEVLTSWAAVSIVSGSALTKNADRYNHEMYLVDNLGHRYDHVGTTGAAQDGGSTNTQKLPPLTGSFIFPPPQPGARSFTFYDNDQHVSLSFQLTNPAP